uniref:glutathione transferase n=1 Tax=Tarenaya spinosa TaxID=228870 RepID=B2BXQ6_9ROSI|nr:GST17 [Tarenaya spinosa]
MAEEEEVKLLGLWSSPFSCRIEMALKLKGLNPVHKKIPVFVHNGKPIAESLVILDYIDETWKHNPILPQDPYERAMARFWARFIDEQVLLTGLKIVAQTGREREAAVEATRDLVKFLEKELKGKDFFGGESFGYLDMVATLVAFWLMRSDDLVGVEVLPEEKFPEIHRWVKKLSEIPVVKECVPPKDKHVQYLRARLERIKSA